MKILIYSEFYGRTSGYSRAVRDIVPFLAKDNELAHVGLGYDGMPPDDHKYFSYVFPGENKKAVRYWAVETLAYALESFQPDVVLSLNDFWATKKFAFPLSHPGPWKWVHWGTLDTDPLDHESREAVRWVDYVFYFSQFAKKETEKIFPQMQGEVIYPATNPEKFYELEDKSEYRKKYTPGDTKVLLTCGRNQQRKNIPVLLEAMKTITKERDDVVLVLASNTQVTTTEGEPEGYNYGHFISDFGIEDKVISPYVRTGEPISDKTLNVLYNIADIQVHTSVGEGFGMPLAEGFASGLPAIGIDHSAVTEVIKGHGELIEPRTFFYSPVGGRYYLTHPDDVAEKVLEALSEPGKWENYGKEGQKWVAKFTPERQANRILKALKKVVDKNITNIARSEYVKNG